MMKTENREVLQERYELATERLKGIGKENFEKKEGSNEMSILRKRKYKSGGFKTGG